MSTEHMKQLQYTKKESKESEVTLIPIALPGTLPYYTAPLSTLNSSTPLYQNSSSTLPSLLPYYTAPPPMPLYQNNPNTLPSLLPYYTTPPPPMPLYQNSPSTLPSLLPYPAPVYQTTMTDLPERPLYTSSQHQAYFSQPLELKIPQSNSRSLSGRIDFSFQSTPSTTQSDPALASKMPSSSSTKTNMREPNFGNPQTHVESPVLAGANLEWFQNVVRQQGLGAALYYLAERYKHGHNGFPENQKEAIRLYAAAIDAADRRIAGAASYILAQYYESGTVVNVDLKKVAHYYSKAADWGHPDALAKYYELYLKKADPPLTGQNLQWFQTVARKKGPAAALYYLAVFYECGYQDRNSKLNFPMNKEAALELYTAAIGASDTQISGEASYSVGRFHESGTVVKPDFEQAANYYLRAAHLNHSNAAAKYYGLCQATGMHIGEEIKKKERVRTLMRTADKGGLEAQLALGQYYLYGYQPLNLQKNILLGTHYLLLYTKQDNSSDSPAIAEIQKNLPEIFKMATALSDGDSDQIEAAKRLFQVVVTYGQEKDRWLRMEAQTQRDLLYSFAIKSFAESKTPPSPTSAYSSTNVSGTSFTVRRGSPYITQPVPQIQTPSQSEKDTDPTQIIQPRSHGK